MKKLGVLIILLLGSSQSFGAMATIDNIGTLDTPKKMMQAIDENFTELGTFKNGIDTDDDESIADEDIAVQSLTTDGADGDRKIVLGNNTALTPDTGESGIANIGNVMYYFNNGGTPTAIGSGGSFAFDTFPTYEDSAHSSGIAVNADTLAVYSSTAGKWLTVGLTDSLDPTPSFPTLSSATIDGTTLTLTFSEAVTQGFGWLETLFNLDGATMGNDIAVTYSSGDGTSTHIFTSSTAAVESEVINLDFSGASDALEDSGGDDLQAITDFAVTNNTTGAVVTDDFNRADGALGSNWATPTNFNAPTIISNVVRSSTGISAAYWSANTFTDDQYAKVTLGTTISGYHGCTVRMSGDGDGYALIPISTTNMRIYRLDDGVRTSIASATITTPVGLDIELRVSGTTLTGYIEGVQVITVTDATYTSGSPGLYTDSISASVTLDNFEGGNL